MGNGSIYRRADLLGKRHWNETRSDSNYIYYGEHGAEAIAMPKVNNERAIKCYEKCGFTKVKVLKEHELHEGVLEDCWMMEYKRIEDR